MSNNNSGYLPKLNEQIAYLNQTVFCIYFCGILFSRFSTGIWLGDHPSKVLLFFFTMVYLYMHLGYLHTLLLRLPFIVLLLYLGQTHLIHPGDFLLSQPFVLSWKHLLLTWTALNLSFLLHAEEYPFVYGTLHRWQGLAQLNSTITAKSKPGLGKIISLPRLRVANRTE